MTRTTVSDALPRTDEDSDTPEDGGADPSADRGRPGRAGPESAAAVGRAPRRGSLLYRGAKRAMDVTLALAGLMLTAPLWPVIALALRMDDGGPVFFSQERVGLRGEHFVSYKFRSMTPESPDSEVPRGAEQESHRITRVGRVLRTTALDELPQLWNVLRGDMSLVGPRALLPAEETREGLQRLRDLPGYQERHSVRPGLTGLAQVNTRRSLPHSKKFRYDLLYVRNRTLWLDLGLVATSVWISLRGAWPEVGRED